MEKKFCTNCGRELAADVKFCPACGTASLEMPLVNSTATAEVAPQAPAAEATASAEVTATSSDENRRKKIGGRLKKLNKKQRILAICTGVAIIAAAVLVYRLPGKCPLDACISSSDLQTDLVALQAEIKQKYDNVSDVDIDVNNYDYNYEFSYDATFLGMDGEVEVHHHNSIRYSSDEYARVEWCSAKNMDAKQALRTYKKLKNYLTRRLGKPTEAEEIGDIDSYYAYWDQIDGSSWSVEVSEYKDSYHCSIEYYIDE